MTAKSSRPRRRNRPATAAAASSRRVKSPPPSHGRRSGRYTDRVVGPNPSPPWFPAAIVGLIVAGVVVVMAAYWGLPAGGVRIAGLAAGSVLFLSGLAAATRYR